MFLGIDRLHALRIRLNKKAIQSSSGYKIAAAAFTKKGNLIDIATNHVRLTLPASKKGAGVHAEATLIKRHKSSIAYIVISRVGRGGQDRPIHPCELCTKLADKYGIKIISICEILDVLEKGENNGDATPSIRSSAKVDE